MTHPEEESSTKKTPGKLGTFTGVFTPSILTILGIILFLRLGYVTGSGGVAQTLVIIGIANLITIITTQSLSAIATNIKVKGGGDYYLISRTLGYEFGGAIGIVLYLAQSVSVAFYCIGFAEALTVLPFGASLPPSLVALAAVCLIFIFAWLGSDWATKFQFVVMGLLIASLISFFVGGIPHWNAQTLAANWATPENSPSFWIIFGIFFPAVTGFTQGVSMSGDLRDPGKSLPLGTFMAVAFSIAIYICMVLVFGGVLSNEVLANDYQAIKQISRFDFLIDCGVFAATLSSAMASFMGGPRILQSLSADKIFPFLKPFAKGSGTSNNPRRAILLTLVIALGTVCLGQLNLVARIVSMFFLISYGLLNYATWYEAHAESPSFRPLFSFFTKDISLLNSISCLVIILALDIENGIIAGAILIAIHFYLRLQNNPTRWSDTSRSHSLKVIRQELLETFQEPAHDRDWRPHTLVFTRDPQKRRLLLRFAHWIAGGSGTITAISMYEGSDIRSRKIGEEIYQEMTGLIREEALDIFPLVVRGDDLNQGLEIVLQSYGIGPIKANTMLVNWPHTEHLTSLQTMKFGNSLRRGFHLGCNLVLFHGDPLRAHAISDTKDKGLKRIDIWWHSSPDGSLMLLLTHLMTRHKFWEQTEIRLLIPRDLVKEDELTIHQYLDESRINTHSVFVTDMKPETIVKQSIDANLVFLPFRIQRSLITDWYGYSPQRVLTRLPPTALVMATREIDLDAEPEEGRAGELAEALDRLQAAEVRQKRLEKRVQENGKNLSRLEEELQQNTSPASIESSTALEKLQRRAENDLRRMAKANLRVEEMMKEVNHLTDTRTDGE